MGESNTYGALVDDADVWVWGCQGGRWCGEWGGHLGFVDIVEERKE